jgi:hypothetical protein
MAKGETEEQAKVRIMGVTMYDDRTDYPNDWDEDTEPGGEWRIGLS